MKNEYEIRGDVTVIFVNSPKFGLTEVLIDTKLLPMMLETNVRWYVKFSIFTKTLYVMGNFKNGKKVFLHRWVTNPPRNLFVDHINHNTLDNRSSNLRICSKSENKRNQRVTGGHSSKYKGVFFDKNSNKYKAQIKLDGRQLALGYFHSDIDAAKAYNDAAIKLFGEFANLNNLEQPQN